MTQYCFVTVSPRGPASRKRPERRRWRIPASVPGYGQPKRSTAKGLISANGVSPVIISANSRPVDLDGVLEPGYVYRLAATASASTNTPAPLGDVATGGRTTSDVTFTLTAVPEPSAAAVLAIGAAATLGRRRGRRRNSAVRPSHLRTLNRGA